MIADGAQLRAARAALGLSQIELAELAGVGRATIDRLERKKEDFEKAGDQTLRALEHTLLMRGVRIEVGDDGERIVRWQRRGAK
jgi:transcriptional regulator with XRE-family HTH domain